MDEFERPNSEQLTDLHVYLIPPDHWRVHLHSAANTIINDAVSAGFIRVLPETTVYQLRSELHQQLGYDVLPPEYVFLKSVGRCLTRVRPKQEYLLKVKNFLPPSQPSDKLEESTTRNPRIVNAYAPEIFVLEATPEILEAPYSTSSSSQATPQRHNGATPQRHNATPRSDKSEFSGHRTVPPIRRNSLGVQTKGRHSRRPSQDHQGATPPDTQRANILRQDSEDERRHLDDLRRRQREREEDEERRRQQQEDRRHEDERRQREEDERQRKDEQRQREDEQKRLDEEERRRRAQEQLEEELRRREEQEQRDRSKEDEEADRRREEADRRREEADREEIEPQRADSEPAHSQRSRAGTSSPTEPSSEVRALHEELRRAKQERQEVERRREELVRTAKTLQGRTQQRRSQARDTWKKRYYEEKKRTAPLEERCGRLRGELDALHRRIMSQMEGGKDNKVVSGKTPSQQSNLKIEATRLGHDIEDLQRRVENVKMKLTTEMKLRSQAEGELKALRAELTQKKISLALTRTSQNSQLAVGSQAQNSQLAVGSQGPGYKTPNPHMITPRS